MFQQLPVPQGGVVGGCWATGMSPVVDFEMSTVGLLAVGKREKTVGPCWMCISCCNFVPMTWSGPVL